MEEIFNLVFLIKFITACFGIGMALYLGKYAKSLLLWVKGGIEDGDGKLENKELQIAWFSLLSAFIIISHAIFNIDYPDAVVYCTFGAATGMYLGRQFLSKKDDDKKESSRKKEDDGEF